MPSIGLLKAPSIALAALILPKNVATAGTSSFICFIAIAGRAGHSIPVDIVFKIITGYSRCRSKETSSTCGTCEQAAEAAVFFVIVYWKSYVAHYCFVIFVSFLRFCRNRTLEQTLSRNLLFV